MEFFKGVAMALVPILLVGLFLAFQSTRGGV